MHIPEDVLFPPFTLQLQLYSDGNQLYKMDIFYNWCVECQCRRLHVVLLVDGFIESGIPGFIGIEILQPLVESVFYFDEVSPDFALEPEGEGAVMDACFPGHIYLLDIELLQGIVDLGPGILLVLVGFLVHHRGGHPFFHRVDYLFINIQTLIIYYLLSLLSWYYLRILA